eukprot:1181191-Prorocentrum_minimum.AAC.4
MVRIKSILSFPLGEAHRHELHSQPATRINTESIPHRHYPFHMLDMLATARMRLALEALIFIYIYKCQSFQGEALTGPFLFCEGGVRDPVVCTQLGRNVDCCQRSGAKANHIWSPGRVWNVTLSKVAGEGLLIAPLFKCPRLLSSPPLMSSHVLSSSSHVLSCPLMSSHVLSCPLMSSHVLSCPLMSSPPPHVLSPSSHVLSYSSHVLSCPLMSSHVLSSSHVLVCSPLLLS